MFSEEAAGSDSIQPGRLRTRSRRFASEQRLTIRGSQTAASTCGCGNPFAPDADTPVARTVGLIRADLMNTLVAGLRQARRDTHGAIRPADRGPSSGGSMGNIR